MENTHFTFIVPKKDPQKKKQKQKYPALSLTRSLQQSPRLRDYLTQRDRGTPLRYKHCKSTRSDPGLIETPYGVRSVTYPRKIRNKEIKSNNYSLLPSFRVRVPIHLRRSVRLVLRLFACRLGTNLSALLARPHRSR